MKNASSKGNPLLSYILFTCLFLLINTKSRSQDLIWAWDPGFGDYVSIKSVATDDAGNNYLLGVFQDTVDFDPGPGVHNIIPPSTIANSTWLAKYDSVGHFKWAKIIYTIPYVNPGTIKYHNNSLYITGLLSGTADFNAGPGIDTITSISSPPQLDFYWQKLDTAGNHIYVRHLGSTQNIPFNAQLFVDPFDRVWLLGSTAATVDYNPGAGVSIPATGGNPYGFMSKYDAAGNFLTMKFIISGGFGNGQCTFDHSGNLITCGAFSGTSNFNPAGIDTLQSIGNSGDGFVAKYDSSGNFIFVRQIGFNLSADAIGQVAVDSLDHIYACGQVTGYWRVGPGPLMNFDIASNVDAVILKFDPMGNLEKWNRWGLGDGDFQYNIAFTRYGDLVTFGIFKGVIDLYSDERELLVPSKGAAINPTSHLFSYLDTDLNFKSFSFVDTSSHTFPGAVDDFGNIYKFEKYTLTHDFDPGSNYYYLKSVSFSGDAYFAKYGRCPGIVIFSDSNVVTTNDSLDFGDLTVNHTSPVKKFKIKNEGQYELILTGIPSVAISGPNASDFVLTQTGINSLLSPGDTTAFTLSFNPGTPGAKSALVTINNNDPKRSQYLLYLFGNAQANSIPAITDFNSFEPNRNFNAGDTIDTYIVYSENVIVTGVPSINLSSGGTAYFSSGSDNDTIYFKYAVQPGDTTNDLDGTGPGSLILNLGGSITDRDTNNASIILPLPGAAGSLSNNKNISVGTTAPHVSFSVATGSRFNTNPITLQILLSENVFGVDTSKINLTNGIISGLTPINQSTYEIQVTPLSNGLITLSLDSAAAMSASTSIVSTQSALLYIYFDDVRPSISYQTNPSPVTSFTSYINFTFSEKIIAPDSTKFTCTNCQLSGFSYSNDTVHATLTLNNSDAAEIIIHPSAVLDQAFNTNDTTIFQITSTAPDLQWVHQYEWNRDKIMSSPYISIMKVNKSGQSIVTAIIFDSLNVAPDTLQYWLHGSATGNVGLLRYDANGSLIKAVSVGASHPYECEIDNMGRTIISMFTVNGADLDPDTGVFAGNGAKQVVLYDSALHFIRALPLDAKIRLDDLGNIYLFVNQTTAFDYDLSSGITIVSGSRIIVKYDKNLNLQWAKKFNADFGSVTVSSNGRIFLVNTFSGIVDFNPDTTVIYNLNSASGNSPTYLVSLNTNGQLVYARQCRFSNSTIAADSRELLYVLVLFGVSSDYDPDTNVVSVEQGLGARFVCYDQQGNLKYKKVFFANNVNAAIAINNSDDVYLSGGFSENLSLDGLQIYAPYGIPFVAKISSDGTSVFLKKMTGNSGHYSTGFGLDSLSNLYICGNFNRMLDVDLNNSQKWIYTNLQWEGYMSKYGPAAEIDIASGGNSYPNNSLYDFGFVTINTQGPPVQFDIANSGIGYLSLYNHPPVTIGGTNPGDFLLNTNNTQNAIPYAGTSSFTIAFAPTDTLQRNAYAEINNSDINESNYFILLTGNGLPVGLANIEDQKGFVIYPNPVANFLYLHFNKQFQDNCRLTIHDALGKIILSEEYSNNTQTISIRMDEKLTNGIYMLDVVNDGEEFHKKFILSR